MDDDVSQSVDALVAESVSEIAGSPYHHEYATPARSATPSVPPGFDLPHAHPSPIIPEEPIARQVSAKIPALPPAVQSTPSRSVAHLASAHVPRVATPLSTVSVPPSPTPVPVVVAPKPSASTKIQSKEQAKEDVKSLATNSGLSKTIATQSTQKAATAPAIKSDEDFPTLENAKTKAKDTSIPSGPRAMNAASKKAVVSPASTPAATTPATAPPVAAAKAVPAKKSTPGILNISVPAVSTPPAPPAPKEAPAKAPVAKPVVESSAFPPLPPSVPASTTFSTTAKGPKTLRVLPTPKAEPPSAAQTPPMSAVLNHPLSLPATRQPSAVSSAPASEGISDNASATSASLSRPGSPPPSRIGSAPVRTKTKSQLKKARKEAMREMTEQELAVEHPEAEEVGPIMGRKKKQKKVKPANAPTLVAPASTRLETPKTAERLEVEKTRKASADSESKKAVAPESTPKIEEMKAKGKGKAKVEEAILPDPPAPSVEHEEEGAEKPIPSPSAVIHDLVVHGEIPEPQSLAILNAPPGYNQRMDFRGDLLRELDGKLVITEEDRADLLAGRPVHKITQGPSRIMLTPNGDCVRNLEPEEEERYLELQHRIFEESGPTAFVPARHNATNGFTLIGGRAVPNGPPTFFPPLDGAHPNGPMDPVSKIQRDEALSYINQYVLPSLSTNSQLERALNANALDAEMLRPADPQTWASWGASNNQGGNTDNRSSQETPYGGNRQDGILASGLESMTAHFAVGRENGRGQPLGNVTLLSLTDSESAMQTAKRETDKLEKSFNQLLKKNRRLLLGAGH